MFQDVSLLGFPIRAFYKLFFLPIISTFADCTI